MKMRLTHPFLMTFCNLIHYNRDTQTEWQVRQGKILKRQFIETICHSSHKLLQFLMNQSRHICCRIVFLLGYDFFCAKKAAHQHSTLSSMRASDENFFCRHFNFVSINVQLHRPEKDTKLLHNCLCYEKNVTAAARCYCMFRATKNIKLQLEIADIAFFCLKTTKKIVFDHIKYRCMQ